MGHLPTPTFQFSLPTSRVIDHNMVSNKPICEDFIEVANSHIQQSMSIQERYVDPNI